MAWRSKQRGDSHLFNSSALALSSSLEALGGMSVLGSVWHRVIDIEDVIPLMFVGIWGPLLWKSEALAFTSPGVCSL